MRIPAVNLKPSIEETRAAWEANFAALIDRGYFILGPELARFEAGFAEAMGARHAIGVSTGSTAIEICLRHAGLTTARQEVFTSALTAPFTAVSIAAAGATPRFADIHPETLSIDPDDLGNRLGKRAAGLVPVHLYGQPAQLDRIRKIARDRQLPIIQDACQAHGATFAGKPLAAYSDYVTYSFYPTKNLGCLGDGGAIVTNKPTAAKQLRQIRDGGRGSGGLPNNQIAFVPGINARLDDLQACFLNAFLPRLKAWNDARGKLAALYDQALAGIDAIQPVRRDTGAVSHLYVVRAQRRDKLRAHLASLGIGTGIHYPVPLHLHPAFAAAKQKKGDLPVAERAAKEIVSLPLWPQLPESAILETVDAIRAFYKR